MYDIFFPSSLFLLTHYLPFSSFSPSFLYFSHIDFGCETISGLFVRSAALWSMANCTTFSITTNYVVAVVRGEYSAGIFMFFQHRGRRWGGNKCFTHSVLTITTSLLVTLSACITKLCTSKFKLITDFIWI